MTKISFIGDVMLGRVIGQRYRKQKYHIVEPALRNRIADCADLVFANLESPVVNKSKTDGDHLQFRGNPDALDELSGLMPSRYRITILQTVGKMELRRL